MHSRTFYPNWGTSMCLFLGTTCTLLPRQQSLLDSGRSHSTLRVYVAAISVRHDPVDSATVGGHRSVSLFLRGAVRQHPPSTPRAPAWDLPLLPDALSSPPFEPLALVAAHEGRISACHGLREASRGVTCHLHKRYMPEVGLSGVALGIPAQGASTNPLQSACPAGTL